MAYQLLNNLIAAAGSSYRFLNNSDDREEEIEDSNSDDFDDNSTSVKCDSTSVKCDSTSVKCDSTSVKSNGDINNNIVTDLNEFLGNGNKIINNNNENNHIEEEYNEYTLFDILNLYIEED